MKKFILSIIAFLLFLAAAGFSAYLLYEVLTLPENPEGISESISKGLSIAVAIVLNMAAAVTFFRYSLFPPWWKLPEKPWQAAPPLLRLLRRFFP